MRGALVLVPALVGFFGMVWLLSRPWLRAYAKTAQRSGPLDPQPGTLVKLAAKPKHGGAQNHALASHGATVVGGSRPEELIDGNDSAYSGGTGFATSVWSTTPPQSFVITLKEAYTVDCVRFLLWDRDDRFYRYRLEICADAAGQAWLAVADRTGPAEECRSWQTVRFKPQPVRRIRLTGTFNSSNSQFHVVELQASLGLPAGTEPATPERMDF